MDCKWNIKNMIKNTKIMLLLTKWIAVDKQKHFLAGLLIVLGLYITLICLTNLEIGTIQNIAVGTMFLIGLLKELYDEYYKSGFDIADIYYTYCGGLCGILLIELFI